MINRNATRTAALTGAALLGLTMTACGGDGGSSAATPTAGDGSSTAAAPTSASSPSSVQTTFASSGTGGDQTTPTGTTSSSGSSGTTGSGDRQPARCGTSALKVSVAEGHPAAGHLSYRIRFQNTSGHPCVIQGFPGVSAVGHDNGTQLGKAASRSGDSGSRITLIPGASGYASIYAVNIGDGGGPLGDECKVAKADGWRIYPPGETRAVYVAQSGMTACTSQSDWLQIGSVQPAS
ncbi:DUF4232 domain-containing protein [Acidipropionibacterium virtanenii]|uniref:DUF4232 domain-containing protein n=1 Tax=Acidipropionibacterium virtanenii TaxID=2057246 RepID=A0A344UXP6_9ACTN|nr:DUF4232 domain-containing protein [Acidipropionibacterium virtanenii]AXE40044.1 hypothetical protein JS278_02910 [Acidipropionibacterium virtanenii]